MKLIEEIEQILQTIYTGSEHIGDVYNKEAAKAILSAIAKRDEERSKCLLDCDNCFVQIEMENEEKYKRD